MKAWLATAVALLACAQLFTAAWIYRKLPFDKPAWVNPVHRWTRAARPSCSRCRSPTTASSGSASRARRTASSLHSLAGCAFYGAYVAKVLIVKMKRYPVWVIPTAGGLLFTVLITVWYTSALLVLHDDRLRNLSRRT